MDKLKSQLQEIVGAEYVSDDDFTLVAYSRDYSAMPPKIPDLVVMPGSTEEVSRVVRLANKTKTPIIARGGATTGDLAIADEGIILDLNRMDKVLKIDEDSMYVTAQGGASVYSISKALRKKGWMLPLSPMFGPMPTIGAWTQTVGCGGHMTDRGYLSESLTGIEVVLPTGEIIRTGTNSMANCEPFCRYTHTSDLTGLFIGGRGSLGIITEVSVRIFAGAEINNREGGFITLGYNEWAPLLKATKEISKADIVATIDVNDGGLGKVVDMELPSPLMITMTVEGDKENVKRKLDIIKNIGNETGAIDLGPAIGTFLYYGEAMAGYVYKKQGYGHMIYIDAYWHTLDAFPPIYKTLKEACDRHNLFLIWYSWVVKGMVCTFPVIAYKEPEQWIDMQQAWKEVSDSWFSEKNVAPAISVPDPVKYNLDLLRPTYYWILKNIKQMLDPNNVLNPEIIPYAGRNQ